MVELEAMAKMKLETKVVDKLDLENVRVLRVVLQRPLVARCLVCLNLR